MRQKLGWLAPLALLLALAACAKAPAQQQAPEPAQLGTLEDFLSCDFWNLTEDELAARLDPDLWSAYARSVVVPETYYLGSIAGDAATLDIVTEDRQKPLSLTLSTVYTMEQRHLTALSPVGECPFEGAVPVPGGIDAVAQWVYRVRETLAAAGWTLGENALLLHGETPEELETMFRETAADQMALLAEWKLSPGFYYQEYLYHAPSGACARIQGYGTLYIRGEESSTQRPGAIRLTLTLLAPGQAEDPESPPEDPYAYWVDGVQHPLRYAYSVRELLARGLFDMTPQALPAQLNPYNFETREEGGSVVCTGDFYSSEEPLTLRAEPGADGSIALLEAQTTLDPNSWLPLGAAYWLSDERAELSLSGAVLREGDSVHIDGDQPSRQEKQFRALAEQLGAQAAENGGTAAGLLREGPYVFPDGQTAAYLLLSFEVDATGRMTAASGTLRLYAPDWQDEDGQHALDWGFGNDPDGFFSGAQLAESLPFRTPLDFLCAEFWNLTPAELGNLLDPAVWQPAEGGWQGTAFEQAALLAVETDAEGRVAAVSLTFGPGEAPAEACARLVLGLRDLMKQTEERYTSVQTLPGETVTALAQQLAQGGLAAVYTLDPVGTQASLRFDAQTGQTQLVFTAPDEAAP